MLTPEEEQFVRDLIQLYKLNGQLNKVAKDRQVAEQAIVEKYKVADCNAERGQLIQQSKIDQDAVQEKITALLNKFSAA